MRSDLGFLKSILNDVIEKIYPELKEYKIDLRIKYGILYPATVVLIDKEDKRVVILKNIDENVLGKGLDLVEEALAKVEKEGIHYRYPPLPTFD